MRNKSLRTLLLVSIVTLSTTAFAAPISIHAFASFCNEALTNTFSRSKSFDDTTDPLTKSIIVPQMSKHGVIAKFAPFLQDGKLMVEANIHVDAISYVRTRPEFFGTVVTRKGNRAHIIFAHIPTLNEQWKSFAKLEMIGIDANIIPTFEYLQYLRNGFLAISLRDSFVHDIFDHALGFQILAADSRWPEFQNAFDRLAAYKATASSRKDGEQYVSSLEKILGDGFEIATARMTEGYLANNSENMSIAVDAFHAALEKFDKLYDEATK